MEVQPESAAASDSYAGQVYYFCCKGCLAKFRVDPAKYLAPAAVRNLVQIGQPVPAPAMPIRQAEAQRYTCPMHPEIIRDQPGNCPICGMALEPMVVSIDEGENPELIDMRRRFWISLVLTIPVFVSAMGVFAMGMSTSRSRVLFEMVLATPVVLWGGWPFFVRAWQSVLSRNLNMFTLIGLGTGVAYFYSVAAVLLGQAPVYFEAAAVITTLVLLGQVLELRARSQTGAAIKALLGLAPKTARLLPCRRLGAGRSVRAGEGRRQAPRPPGREDSGGRCGAGRGEFGGRIDDLR